MLNLNDPFPTRPLTSSKGGQTDLKDVFAKGTTVVAVIPTADAGPWLEAIALQFTVWMMEKFYNVYLVMDVSPEDARFLCDSYGLQAAILCDQAGVYLPTAAGVYRVGSSGVVELAVGLTEGVGELARL